MHDGKRSERYRPETEAGTLLITALSEKPHIRVCCVIRRLKHFSSWDFCDILSFGENQVRNLLKGLHVCLFPREQQSFRPTDTHSPRLYIVYPSHLTKGETKSSTVSACCIGDKRHEPFFGSADHQKAAGRLCEHIEGENSIQAEKVRTCRVAVAGVRWSILPVQTEGSVVPALECP